MVLHYPINKVIGDASYFQLFEEKPIQDSSTEIHRIETHLKYVCTVLSSSRTSLSKKSHSLRKELIQKLEDYATRHEFPQNTFTTKRTPIFIDNQGTPCAVAYLMQCTGDYGLAQKVNKNHRFSYLENIPNGKQKENILNWANKTGFSLSELAMIQPGYCMADITSLFVNSSFCWGIVGLSLGFANIYESFEHNLSDLHFITGVVLTSIAGLGFVWPLCLRRDHLHRSTFFHVCGATLQIIIGLAALGLSFALIAERQTALEICTVVFLLFPLGCNIFFNVPFFWCPFDMEEYYEDRPRTTVEPLDHKEGKEVLEVNFGHY